MGCVTTKDVDKNEKRATQLAQSEEEDKNKKKKERKPRVKKIDDIVDELFLFLKYKVHLTGYEEIPLDSSKRKESLDEDVLKRKVVEDFLKSESKWSEQIVQFIDTRCPHFEDSLEKKRIHSVDWGEFRNLVKDCMVKPLKKHCESIGTKWTTYRPNDLVDRDVVLHMCRFVDEIPSSKRAIVFIKATKDESLFHKLMERRFIDLYEDETKKRAKITEEHYQGEKHHFQNQFKLKLGVAVKEVNCAARWIEPENLRLELIKARKLEKEGKEFESRGIIKLRCGLIDLIVNDLTGNFTPLMIILSSSKSNDEELERRRLECAKILFKEPLLNINRVYDRAGHVGSFMNQTAVFLASKNGHDENLKLILEHRDLDLNIGDDPIEVAETEVAREMLLSHGKGGK